MASGKEAARRKKKEKARKDAAKQHHNRVRIERVDPSTLPKTAVPRALIDDIRAKRDLLVGEDLVRHVVRRYIKKHPTIAKHFQDPQFVRSREYETMKKWVRQELRVLVGLFVVKHDFQKLLTASTDTILQGHRSTAERAPFYEQLYPELFDGKMPSHILDLCAGLNGCAYSYLGCTPKYTAVDVSPELMAFTQAWFDRHSIAGKTYAQDCTTLSATQLAVGDTVFLFKAMDVLERVRYGYGEKLLNELFATPGRRVIVSFARASVSGSHTISLSKRSWVERWAEEHGRSVRIVDTENERYYVLE
jgi:hypothetical protein